MGDLFVNLKVNFPDSIPLDKLKLLEQALPPRAPLPKVENQDAIEDVIMDDLDEREARGARGGANGRRNAGPGGEDMDMDEDEDGPGGGPQVQCAQS